MKEFIVLERNIIATRIIKMVEEYGDNIRIETEDGEVVIPTKDSEGAMDYLITLLN